MAYNCNILPTFVDNTSILFSRFNKSNKSFASWIWKLEEGWNKSYRNIDNEIPLCGPQYQTVTHILVTCNRQPEVTHFNSLSIAVSFIVRQFNCCSILTCIVLLKRGAYVVRVQLWTWLETFCYGLNAVAFVWSERWEAERQGMCSEFGECK
jgi:hypothetical protein